MGEIGSSDVRKIRIPEREVRENIWNEIFKDIAEEKFPRLKKEKKKKDIVPVNEVFSKMNGNLSSPRTSGRNFRTLIKEEILKASRWDS